MSVELVVRDFRPADMAAVVELVRELQLFEEEIYDRLVPAADIGPWYVERLLQDCEKHKGRIRVAEIEGRIVGYATIMTQVVVDDERDEITYSHAYLGDLSVSWSERSRGIGRCLLQDGEAIARAAGAKWLRITAHAANKRACRIYETFGFHQQFIGFEKKLG